MKNIFFFVAIFLALPSWAEIQTNRNYKGVTDSIHALATANPNTTQVMTLGFADRGIAIEGLQIGNGPVKNLLVATHHGNEYGSTELALAFAESLAKDPIPGQTLFIIPVINIDGYNKRSRNDSSSGQSLDLNRDYPGPCGSEGPFYSKNTKALADFIAKNDIVVSSTIHTFWPAVLYPWGISSEDVDTPYTPKFLDLGNAAASFSRYDVGNSNRLIYPADGTFEDYAFWKHGIWSMLFEVGNSHSPNKQSLTAMINSNVPGLRKMYEIAPTSRAESHDFKGQCSLAMKAMDLHIE